MGDSQSKRSCEESGEIWMLGRSHRQVEDISVVTVHVTFNQSFPAESAALPLRGEGRQWSAHRRLAAIYSRGWDTAEGCGFVEHDHQLVRKTRGDKRV